MRRLVPLLLAFALPAPAPVLAAASTSAPVRLLAVAPGAPGAAARSGPAASLPLALDRAALGSLRAAAGGRVALPLPDGRTLTLDLARDDVFAPGATITATGDDGIARPVAPDATLLRGSVEGVPGSIAVLTLTGGTVQGMILSGNERFALAPAQAAGADHVIVDEARLPATRRPFECRSDELEAAAPHAGAPRARIEHPGWVYPSPTRLVCTLAVDCDYEFYASKSGGSTANEIAYLMTLYATASAVYERDVNVTLKVGWLHLWTTVNDPYTSANTADELDEFRGYCWNNYAGVPRTLMHLVSGRSLGGGIAYLHGLCNYSNGFAVYQLDGFYHFPTTATTWDAMVVTHETGHNFGSEHTHSCNWQDRGQAPPGALLDSCYTAEGTCYAGPTGILPPDKGTIMSYCHLIGGMNGIRLEFHKECKSIIRQEAEGSCLPAAAIQPARDLVATSAGSTARLDWLASSSAGVIRYDVYRSAYPFDPNPGLLGSTTGTFFSDPSPGNFVYKVRAARSADSSGFSNEAKAVPCLPPGALTYPAGNDVRGIVAGYFNGDGLPDLVVSNGGMHTVSLLLAQRCALCAAPFSTPASFATAADGFAGPLVSGDFDGDGLPDVAVADGPCITILRGQLGGGFVSGPRIDVPAADILAGDFNEDGIPDFAAVAGSTVAIVPGQGGGTYGAPLSIALAANGRDLAAGDFNGDGIPDLAVATDQGYDVLFGTGAAGKGDGGFAVPVFHFTGRDAQAIVAADLNGDGLLDLATANGTANDVAVMLGTGGGAFAAPTFWPTGPGPTSIAVGDWNQDGRPDLALGTAGIALLFGNATGFDPVSTWPTGGAPVAILATEVTDDERPDIVVANTHGAGAAGSVAVLAMRCAAAASTAVSLTSPNGGESWITPSEHAITWTRGGSVAAVNLDLSRDGGAHWSRIASGVPGTSFAWTATGAYTTQARIRVADAAVDAHDDASDADFTLIPAAALAVDGGAPVRLALRAVGPNPGAGALAVWLALPDARPATLELLDIAGRRVVSRALAGLGAGVHRVDLTRAGELGSGVYVVRLTQAGRSASAKVAVVR